MSSSIGSHERDVHSEQNKEIIQQRRKKRMTNRKACGEGRCRHTGGNNIWRVNKNAVTMTRPGSALRELCRVPEVRDLVGLPTPGSPAKADVLFPIRKNSRPQRFVPEVGSRGHLERGREENHLLTATTSREALTGYFGSRFSPENFFWSFSLYGWVCELCPK